jgi:hypothetical protein
MAEVLTVREYVSITNNAIGETLATEVLRRREVRRPLRPFWRPAVTEIYLCNVCPC